MFPNIIEAAALHVLNTFALKTLGAKQNLQAKSDILCRTAAKINTLLSVGCDCFDSAQNTDCYKNTTNIPSYQGRYCPNKASTYQSTFATLAINSSTTEVECEIIFLQQLTASIFKNQQDPIKLSSNFVAFQTSTEMYAIKNSNNAVVANLLGNGVKVQFNVYPKTCI